MSCKNLKISEMPGVCRIEGSEIIPLVQEGENKVIAIKELVEVKQKQLFVQLIELMIKLKKLMLYLLIILNRLNLYSLNYVHQMPRLY